MAVKRLARSIAGAMLALAALPCGPARAQAPRPPNIVLLVADDLGWRDVGYHGSEIATPHIDRIAQEGLELDRFYVWPTCSPTRAALLTGKSPMRLGITQPISKNQPKGLPLEEVTLADRLRDAGYQTFLAGKWHLGYAEKRYQPHRRGFDEAYGYVTGGVGYWDHNHGGGHDWQRNGVTLREEGYTTHLIADEALARLARRDPARPTFLYVAFNAPHLPNEAPDEAIDRFPGIEGPNRRVHAAMVSELDIAIGRILAGLEAAGMKDDTIVWFFSDNGGLSRGSQPESMVRSAHWISQTFGRPLPIDLLEFFLHNALDGASDNRPLRAGKGSVYEGGTRVPSALWWPGRLEGERRDAFVSVQDVLPTLLEAAGVSQPSGLDGVSRLGVLRDTARDDAPAPFATSGLDGEALTVWPWKLVQPSGGLFSDAAPELYRLDLDPTEQRDLAAEQPARVEAMAAQLRDIPRGPSIHLPLWRIALDPDRFGGPEDREPWVDRAR